MGIVAEKLAKCFGRSVAVAGISFAIRPGETYGLIGPNGAGKTTTLRMLAGLLQPSSGQARICGHDVQGEPEQAKACLAFQTASTGLYERLTPRELLSYFGRLYGLERGALDARIAELSETLRFTPLLGRRCGTLSSGEKQRVALARALVHDPPVLILDEPTAGLDVVASRFVADVIREARDRGKAVLLSTHYMSEAELLADRIGLLYRGLLLRETTPAALKEELQVRSLEEAFLQLVEQEEAS